MRRIMALAVGLVGVTNLIGLAGDTGAAGKRIDNFVLRDFRGKEYSIASNAGGGPIVVAFTGTECPLAKLYAPRLADLARQFEPKGVRFLAINANYQDSIAELAAYVRLHEIPFPVLKDPNASVADLFGATRTPEVFVVDGTGTVRYHGRIDDQYGVGYQRPEPTRHDLADALNELLAGGSVSLPVTNAVGCLIGRVRKVAPHGEVTYSDQIARILQHRCVECHREGEIAPFPLTNYEEVVGWGPTIGEVIRDGRMPPWFASPAYGHFANDARLDDDEKELLHAWVANGCPEGDPADLPEPARFISGWNIGEPDDVFYMSDAPYMVAAEGTLPYQHYLIDPGFTEDKWVRACEARPGNRSVVHHILVFVLPPDRGRPRGITDFLGGALIGGYAPGSSVLRLPTGMARHVPAGSKLLFQVHYTPNGSVQTDRSYLGLVYSDPKEVKQAVKAGQALNFLLAIPPGADNYKVSALYQFEEDKLLLSLVPHMHLRGKSFRYEAAYPDGRREILLDVPRYDFNWQLQYDLVEPKLMPAGTRIKCTAHFDNSEKNLANPDPTEWVHFGEQTTDEMMIGFFTVADVEPWAAP